MPFATYADIEPLLPRALRQIVQQDFAQLEAEAAKIIRDYTQTPIPADPADAPDWVRTPLALLIAYLAASAASALSPELQQQIESMRRQAYQILDLHRKRQPEGTQARLGQIEGIYE